MDMTKYTSDKEVRDWLKPTTLLDKGISEIEVVVDEVREHEFEDGVVKPIIDVSRGEDEYSWTLNKVNTNTLIDKLGVESDNWKNKNVNIRLEKTDFQGKRVDCLRVV